MVRPLGRPLARRAITLEDLREEFLAHCEARNLSGRTLEWYAERTRRFTDWCSSRGISVPSDLRWSDLEEFVLDCRRRGFAPNTVHGYAQVVKTLCRLGHRMGYLRQEITAGFQMPRVPRTIVPTFSDQQLQDLLAAPDRRTWAGIRDWAIILVLLDTLLRVSEMVGLDAEHVDLEEEVVRVMGKGGKERLVPFGTSAAQGLRRYRCAVEDLRTGDPFFITRYGRRMSRRAVYEMISLYGLAAGIHGIRCSPHTLRHTGAKRFILAGGDVFTLQKLLGHTTLAMVRRYVELADMDVKAQHQRFSPADSLLRKPTPTRVIQGKAAR
jgi:integrase/recombinase XerD